MRKDIWRLKERTEQTTTWEVFLEKNWKPFTVPFQYLPTPLWAQKNGRTVKETQALAGNGRLTVGSEMPATIVVGKKRFIHEGAVVKPANWSRWSGRDENKLSIAQAATVLGASYASVRKWILRKNLPCIVLSEGDQCTVRALKMSDLENFMRSKTYLDFKEKAALASQCLIIFIGFGGWIAYL